MLKWEHEYSRQWNLRGARRVVHDYDGDATYIAEFVELLPSNSFLVISVPDFPAYNFSLQYDNSDSLSKSFNELKEAVHQIEDLKLITPEIFLAPFLEAIRSEETTGPITSIALSAVNKFLSYGLIGEF